MLKFIQILFPSRFDVSWVIYTVDRMELGAGLLQTVDLGAGHSWDPKLAKDPEDIVFESNFTDLKPVQFC